MGEKGKAINIEMTVDLLKSQFCVNFITKVVFVYASVGTLFSFLFSPHAKQHCLVEFLEN